MKVKSAILRASGAERPYATSKPIKIEQIDLDSPEAGEVLIQIKAASLCHSDLSVINGSRPRPLPMALGHEAAGIVIETGAGVTNFHPGDKVICVFVPSCGQCIPCAEGRPALCEPGAESNGAGTLLGGGKRIHNGSENIGHHVGVSAFSEYAVVAQNSLVKVEGDLPFEKMALFGCAVITGVGAVVNTAKVTLGSKVAVIGLGGIGLSALLGAIAVGANEVIAIDINEKKLKQAKELGATATFNSNDPDVIEQVRAYTNGGVHYAFETAGVVAAMEIAYGVTRRGGVTTTTGLPHPEHKFAFPYVTLTAEERTVKGSYVGSCVPKRDIPNYIHLMEQGRLPVDRLLSNIISLDEINEGFDLLATGDASRIIIKMD